MKVIIAGGRDFECEEYFLECMETVEWEISEIVCGKAAGADTMGMLYGEIESINVSMFPADWARNGRGAGHIRNKEMAEHADALILFWDGKSKGSENMLNIASKLGLEIKVFPY